MASLRWWEGVGVGGVPRGVRGCVCYRVGGARCRSVVHWCDKARWARGLALEQWPAVHSGRDTCATRLVGNGASLRQVMQWGGWSSLGAVQRYAHVDMQALQAAAQLVECVPCGGPNPLQKMPATNFQLQL